LSVEAGLISGFIQGSGIKPVCFLIYIDELAKLLERHGVVVKLFADNVKVYLEICNIDDATRLQNSLDLISQWADEWQLSVSISKSNILSIRQSSGTCTFSNGTVLDRNYVPALLLSTL